MSIVTKTTPRHECYDDVTAVSNSERVLCDGREIPVRSSNEKAVGSLPVPLASFRTALQGRATPVTRIQGKDMFDAITDRLVSEKRQASRTPPTHRASIA